MALEIPTDFHPGLLPFAWRLGSWHGNGKGAYPMIEAFDYEQDVIFAHDGRPFVHFFSQSWVTDNNVEFVLAHNTGFAEIWYGTIDGSRLKPATDVAARTENVKEYNTAGKRI